MSARLVFLILLGLLGNSFGFFSRTVPAICLPQSFVLYAEEASNKPEVISCETTGSCRETRVAYKQQLEKQRQEKRAAGIDFENDYASKLSGGKPPTGKKFSPFGGAKKNASKQIGGSGDVMSF